MVQDMIDRVRQLPLYCLRPKTDTSTGECGTHSTDVVTTDPGRVLVTGLIADARGATPPGAMFKPPILRNLAVRAPYFHGGSAPTVEHLITFYNLRFGFGLTSDQQADLANFLNAL